MNQKTINYYTFIFITCNFLLFFVNQKKKKNLLDMYL